VAISLAHFMGGAHELSTGVDVTISAGTARVWTITASGAGIKVKLEDPADWTYRLGYPVLYVINAGGVNSFDLCRSDGVVLDSIPTGQCASVGLRSLSGVGTWQVQVA